MPAIHPPRPSGPLRGAPPGFTLVEIVVVMLLMSIVTAVVLGRSITTGEVDVAGQTDKIRNHLRYAQSVAMKRSDKVWGIRFSGSEYWYFSQTIVDPPAVPTIEEVKLPGGEYDSSPTRIKYDDLGISVSVTGLGDNSTVIFDGIGKPYAAYTNGATNTPVGGSPPNPAANATITISAADASRDIQITPGTGLIQ